MIKITQTTLLRIKGTVQNNLFVKSDVPTLSRKSNWPILLIAGNYTRVVKACDSKWGVCDKMDIGPVTVPEPEAQTPITGEVVTEIMKQEGMLMLVYSCCLRHLHSNFSSGPKDSSDIHRFSTGSESYSAIHKAAGKNHSRLCLAEFLKMQVKPSMGNGLWGLFQPTAEWWMAALWIALLIMWAVENMWIADASLSKLEKFQCISAWCKLIVQY